jgi:hypothetical protein
VKSDPPNDRLLTANEVDADPSILSHPDAPLRTRNRSGQKGGASKMHFDEAYVRRKFSMLESPAYLVLTLSARRVMDRLEIELGRHKGKPEENGNLACTFEDFVEYGLTRHAIAPAIRELVALGFIRITRKGSAGNESYRVPTLYLITYQFSGSNIILEDGWKRIQTIEEAEATAERAREAKPDPRAAEFGRRGGKARWAKNKSPVMERVPAPVMERVPKPSDGKGTEQPDSPVMERVPLSRVSRGRAIEDNERHGAEPLKLASLPWRAPRRDIPPVVWPVDVAFPINGHSVDMPGSPRVIIREEMVH